MSLPRRKVRSIMFQTREWCCDILTASRRSMSVNTPNWIKKAHVSKVDVFVIALNPRRIPFEIADTNPPRILQAAYTLGPQYLTLDNTNAQIVGSGYHFRGSIKKTPTAEDAGDATKAGDVSTRSFSRWATQRTERVAVFACGSRQSPRRVGRRLPARAYPTRPPS